MKKFIFAVAVVLVCGASSIVLAKENSTEECDALLRKKIANDANYIKANLAPALLEMKRSVEDLVKSQKPDSLIPNEETYEASKVEYDESVRRYFGHNSRPKLKND